MQGLLFFAAMLIGAGIFALLEKYSSGKTFAGQVQAVWEGYDYASSGRMFFAVTVFALLNQAIELGYSIAGLARGM